MSTLKVTNIESPSGGGVNAKITDINGGQLSNRNLIINGAMQVSQRGTSHSFAHDGTAAGYTLDRMSFVTANLESFDGTVTQSTDAPAGFSNSWKLTTGTAEAAIDANDIAYVQLPLEAQNLQLLQYGAASAQTFTLSFYVKASITGTYGCTFYQADALRNRTATYTINTADTWEFKTITLTGDASGTINNDNGAGLQVAWNFATGSDWDSTDSTSWGAFVNSRWGFGHAQDGVITTANATWQITGVQLEVGDVATAFEHRSYGDELAKCQRYYQDGTYFQTDGNGPVTVHFIREMRAAPVMAVTASTAITGAAAGTAHYTGASTGNTATEFTVYNPGGSNVIGCTYTANAEL